MNKYLSWLAIVIVVGISLWSASVFMKSPQNPNSSISTPTQTTNPANATNRYIDYNPQSFANNNTSRRVLFFHAKWCPTCKEANDKFNQNQSRIPEDVILFKTDYDTNDDLKKKHAITYQHTFVQVDQNGDEITKWNGGDINELLANIK